MSAAPVPGRVTAATTGNVVVFHLGMRINDVRAVRSWWPVTAAMPRMLKELTDDPRSGLLGFRNRISPPREIELIQYWESHEKLLAYASAPDRQHRPAWGAFNRRIRESRGAVGIWHETYLIPAGAHESVYVDMPPHGLAQATGTIPVTRRGHTAAERLGLRPTG